MQRGPQCCGVAASGTGNYIEEAFFEFSEGRHLSKYEVRLCIYMFVRLYTLFYDIVVITTHILTMYGLRLDFHLRIGRKLPLPPKQLNVGEGRDAKGLRQARTDLVEIRSRGRAVARIVQRAHVQLKLFLPTRHSSRTERWVRIVARARRPLSKLLLQLTLKHVEKKADPM